MSRPAASTPARPVRRSVLRLVPAVAWMAVIFILSSRPDLPDVGGLPTQVTSVLGHLGAYAVLAALVWWALPAVPGRRRVVVAFAVAVLYGVTDEWHQAFVPGRRPDVLDLATGAIGAAVGLAVLTLLDRRRGVVTGGAGPGVRATPRR